MAWLDANHLGYTREELRAWFDHPARDRIPMPGVIEWRQRQAAGQDWQALAHGDLAGAESPDPNVARIAWLEHSIAQASEELAQRDAERDRLTRKAAQQEQTIREQAAMIEQKLSAIEQQARSLQQKDAEAEQYQNATARLNATIADKNTEIERHQETARKLKDGLAAKDEAAGQLAVRITELRAAVTAKDAAIDQLKAEITQLKTAADRAPARTPNTGAPDPLELLLQHEEKLGRQMTAHIRGLETENELLRRQLARSEDRANRDRE